LEAQRPPVAGFECIIVDDGSIDGTAQLLQHYQATFPLRTITHKTNQGRAAARNAGWRQATGEIVIFLDADTLPAPQWLCDYDRAFSMDHDVVSGSRYCVENNPVSSGFRQRLCSLCDSQPESLFREDIESQFEKLHGASSVGPYRSPIFEKFEGELQTLCQTYPQSVLCAYSFMTSNVAVRRNLLEWTNGFDSFLRRGEDTDLGIRIWELGSHFAYAEGAAAYHQYDPDQADRDLTYAEHLSFFYRNPYKLVALLYFWLRECESLQEGVAPLADGLTQLVKIASELRDPDLIAEYCLKYRFIPPIDCQLTTEDLVRCYTITTGLADSTIREYLDKAVADGLYVRHSEGKTLFDFHITSNWLRYRTTFQEKWISATSYSRTHKTSCARTGNRSVHALCEYRGTYEVAIDRGTGSNCTIEALANIPLPIAGRAQLDVKILSCSPPDLLETGSSGQRLIRRYDVPLGTGEFHVRYDFECKVLEVTSPSQDHSDDLPSRYTSISWSNKWHPKLESILRKLNLSVLATEEQKAWAIYQWILDHTFYSSSPFQDANILDMGCGSCLDQTRLFINLCRSVGIPARERCGALLQRTATDQDRCLFETVALSASPFAHTWAECYISERGWVSVEFLAQSYGKRVLRPFNVTDQSLRREIVTDTPVYDGYYFGAVDPYRIHAAPEVALAPMYPILAKRNTASGNRRQTPAVLHRLQCHLVNYFEIE